MILFRKGFLCDSLNVVYKTKKILAVNCVIGSKNVTVVNVYEELADVIRNIQVEDVLICGDFNCVLDKKLM